MTYTITGELIRRESPHAIFSEKRKIEITRWNGSRDAGTVRMIYACWHYIFGEKVSHDNLGQAWAVANAFTESQQMELAENAYATEIGSVI